LPPPIAQLRGEATAVAAAGPWLVVATSTQSCALTVIRLPKTIAPRAVAVPPSLECLESQGSTDATFDELWVGKTTLTALLSYSPSPHGVSYHLWSAPLANGRLRSAAEWSWTDSDVADGCIVSVAAGNGAIASTNDPNPLGVRYGIDNEVTCPAGKQTTVTVRDAVSARFVVDGAWSVLATNGKQVALARIKRDGTRTGEIELVGLDGMPVATPQLSPQAAKSAIRGWLTPDGLFVETLAGVSGPGWSIATKSHASVANGRLFYVKKGVLRVRRLSDGADHVLVSSVPREALIAAGSFGLAVVTADGKPNVHRLPWSTIDGVLPAK
jgi:hypothetical protein